MVTLGVALMLYELANQLAWLTGGADGLQGVVDEAGARPLRLRSLRPHGLSLQPDRRCSCCSCSRAGSCTRRSACRCARSRAIRCARRASACSPARRLVRDLHARRRLCRHRRRAAGPDDAVRLARRAATSTARPTCCWCWCSAARAISTAACIGAIVFKVMQDCARPASRRNTGSSGSASSWCVLVLVGRERHHRLALTRWRASLASGAQRREAGA